MLLTVPSIFAIDENNGSISIILYRENDVSIKINSIDLHIEKYKDFNVEYIKKFRKLKNGEKRMYNHLIMSLKSYVF